VTFFPAVTLAAIVGGLWPGLFATVIGLLLATYIFTPPYNSFSGEALRASFWSNVVFLMDGIIVCSSIEACTATAHRNAVKLAEAQAQHEEARQLQKEAEALLHRNQALMQTSMDGIHVMDSQGNLMEANDAFCNMLGYTREEMVSLNVADWDAQWTVEELREKSGSLPAGAPCSRPSGAARTVRCSDVEIGASGVEIEEQKLRFSASSAISPRARRPKQCLRQHKVCARYLDDGFW